MASSRRKPDRLEGLAAVQLVEALRTCRLTLRDVTADLRFEAPAAHGCRMVIAAIDALAHLITGRPHLFASRMLERGEIKLARRSAPRRLSGCSTRSANAAAARSAR
jgi:hypothetical protein